MVDINKYESLFIIDKCITVKTTTTDFGGDIETDIGCDISTTMSLPKYL